MKMIKILVVLFTLISLPSIAFAIQAKNIKTLQGPNKPKHGGGESGGGYGQ